MSEVEARPPPNRGRSSARGGRGGIGRGGPRGGRRPVNGSANDSTPIEDSIDDQGELGEIKKKYSSELNMLKDMFPDWTDVDLVFALQETDGDLPSTVERITQGNVSQFAEVKSAKDRARSKVKDESATAGATDKQAARGGRGRGGLESTRGGRGRGSDRGRGGFKGARGGHATSDAQKAPITATTESSAWGTTTTSDSATGGWDTTPKEASVQTATDAAQAAWATEPTSNAPATSTIAAPAPEATKSSAVTEGGAKKSWASMFSQPKPAPVPVPAKQAPIVQPAAPPAPAAQQAPPAAEKAPESPKADVTPTRAIQEPASTPSARDEATLTPTKIPLTEENVEHLPDESNPPATQTAASTAGSVDIRNLTPLPNQPTPIARPGPQVGGYAASAYRATAIPQRSASFQRKVKEQQEAVVMPGHNAVDRATVQFGSMGLNGEPGPDVDEEREEPETRQAPQSSPPSQPRTSLPPASRQSVPAQEQPEGLPTQKQAPGLPPASAQNQQQLQDPSMPPGITQDQAQLNSNYNQYARYGQPGIQHDAGAQKPYDAFGHQAQANQYDQYNMHAQQQQQQAQQQTQSGFGGLSSAPSDYSSYYTAADQARYNQYYGGTYGQQDTRAQVGQGQQDAGSAQQRSSSGFGAGPNDAAFSSQTQQQGQSRFGEAPGSGQNTPNPLMGGQQHTAPAAQQSHLMHQAPAHQQQAAYPPGASAAFPYGHPYYTSPYQAAYQNQFGYNGQPAGYGSGYGGKQGGMYGMPQGYGSSYDQQQQQHASSPANAGAFAQNPTSMRSASGMGSAIGGGLEDYGRTSAQSGSHQQSAALGGINDPFARSGSGIGAQVGYGGHQTATTGAPDDSLKAFADSKNGPSPALGQPGRPGSAANGTGASAQSGLPPPQSQQSGFGGYPGFPSQNSQYGQLGGLGNQQGQQQQQQQQQGQQQGQGSMGGYGQYGAGGFGQTYGGYGSRGGWGSNYGAH